MDTAAGEAGVETEIPGGDPDFASFFASQRAGAFRFAYVLVGDASIAEEVVADAFARLYPRWRKVDEPGPYLRRAIVNHARGGFRRSAVRRRYEARVSRSDDVPGSDEGLDERERVRRAMLALPPRERAVVALRFLEDRSESETAELLGIAVGTVKSQAARGLAHLRAALTDEEEAR